MLSLSLLAAPLMMACGDDAPTNPDMPTPIDMPPPVDMPRVVDFDSDEAGEVRVEYIRNATGGTTVRATGYLFKDPGATKYHSYINLNGCTNTTPAMRESWPFKLEADRVYADAGDMSITNPGDSSSFPIPKNAAAGADPFARAHTANNWYFKGPAFADNDGGLLPPKTRMGVSFSGSADIPAQSFDDALYVPADFALHDSNNDPYPAASVDDPLPGTPLVDGEDLVVNFENSDDQEPAGYRVDALVAFTSGAAGPGTDGVTGPVVVCIEPKDGSVTVPAAMVAVGRAAYPAGGTFARQTLTHVVRELVDNDGPTGRRIDFISVWCYATGFSVPVATP